MTNRFFYPLILLVVCSACDVLSDVVDQVNIPTDQLLSGNALQRFHKRSPISTTFDDAVYEAQNLYNFEPEAIEYKPLDIQPKAPDGGYVLQSGLYSMNAKSFCLRGYTHGPTRGDGHLFAPLEGKKAGLVQAIIQRYGEKPHVSQKNIQVLLWAIIAGADMNALGEQYAGTLSQLFTAQELLTFQGQDWLNGIANEQIDELRALALNNMSSQLRGFLESDNKIRSLVGENRSFNAIEQVAVLAGAAPASDMIREVSKGRWSKHPDGYYVRFFPNGYPQTRVDVYVPFEGESPQELAGKNNVNQHSSRQSQEVVFNPATMVAMPANQSSQRIGVSPNPVNPSPTPPEEEGRRVIPFHFPQVAYLPIEGAGINGSFVIKGFAILEERNGNETLEVIVNGLSSASSFGQLTFSGKVKLLVNDEEVESLPIVRNPGQTVALPTDGTVHVGDVRFSLNAWQNKRIAIKIEAGYMVALNGGGVATPIPVQLKEEVNIR